MSSLGGYLATATAVVPIPRARARTASASWDGNCLCGLVHEAAPGPFYNEAAFRYFLGVERRRAQRSGQPFHLLTVDVGARTDTGDRVGTSLVLRVFAGLRECLRETDILGWYQHGRVLGAVLAEFRPGSRAEIEHFTGRVSTTLRRRLTPAVAAHLQVQLQQCESDTTESGSSAVRRLT
jgi:hypothetical protein